MNAGNSIIDKKLFYLCSQFDYNITEVKQIKFDQNGSTRRTMYDCGICEGATLHKRWCYECTRNAEVQDIIDYLTANHIILMCVFIRMFDS